MLIFLCVVLYRVGQAKNDRNDAGEQGARAASTEFFRSARMFVAALGWFCFDTLRRKFANVLRMSVLALFL